MSMFVQKLITSVVIASGWQTTSKTGLSYQRAVICNHNNETVYQVHPRGMSFHLVREQGFIMMRYDDRRPFAASVFYESIRFSEGECHTLLIRLFFKSQLQKQKCLLDLFLHFSW